MEQARDWERLFMGEIKAGRDPRITPTAKQQPINLQHVAGFLDAYFERHVTPSGIRSAPTVAGHIKVLKECFNDLPVKALDDPDVINRFKTSDYARRVELSTLHRVLAVLRAAIHWGQAQGEMLLIQNKRVDWDTHTVGIPGHTTKDKENRRIPFDPDGRLAAIVRRRGKLGPNAFVFGTENGEYVASFKTAWESLLLIANGHDTKRSKHGARVDREKLRQIDLHWHDIRHEGACRLLADGVDIRIIHLMLGHASVQQTQRYLNVTDEELRRGLEISWKRRTLKVVGGSNA